MVLRFRRGCNYSFEIGRVIRDRPCNTYEHSEGEKQKQNPDQRFRDRYFGADATFCGKVTDENFLKKNLHLPIPHSELSSNDGMSAADQNYGY